MKHGKKLSLREKKMLAKEGHDPAKFLRVKRTIEHIEFVNVDTQVILPVRW